MKTPSCHSRGRQPAHRSLAPGRLRWPCAGSYRRAHLAYQSPTAPPAAPTKPALKGELSSLCTPQEVGARA